MIFEQLQRASPILKDAFKDAIVCEMLDSEREIIVIIKAFYDTYFNYLNDSLLIAMEHKYPTLKDHIEFLRDEDIFEQLGDIQSEIHEYGYSSPKDQSLTQKSFNMKLDVINFTAQVLTLEIEFFICAGIAMFDIACEEDVTVESVAGNMLYADKIFNRVFEKYVDAKEFFVKLKDQQIQDMKNQRKLYETMIIQEKDNHHKCNIIKEELSELPSQIEYNSFQDDLLEFRLKELLVFFN